MNIEHNPTLHRYQLIDWSKPNNAYKPETYAQFSIREAEQVNRALRMNQTTLRYIKCCPKE